MCGCEFSDGGKGGKEGERQVVRKEVSGVLQGWGPDLQAQWPDLGGKGLDEDRTEGKLPLLHYSTPEK